MNDPWQILILDVNTATEKDVKAAYARLLKQHRPDVDPEGFRRVRDAYETALAMVRDRDANGTPPPSYSQPTQEEGSESNPESPVSAPVFTPPSVELPEAVQPSYAEVERAVASANAEQFEAALQAFLRECESARVNPSICANALQQACSGNVKLLASAAPIHFLLSLAEHGQVDLSHLVLSAWGEENRRDRVMQFGSAILDHARGLATPEGGMLMARVGVMIGLEKPGMATSLGNLAFPHLPVDLRTQIMGQLEHEAALGKAFEEVTAEMKPFWFDRLRNANESHDWSDVRSLRALDDLINRNRYMWQGWGIIQQLLPPDRWAQVEGRLRNQAHQVAQSTPRASKFPGWLVFPIIVIGLNLLRFLGSDSTSSNRYSVPRSYPSSSSSVTYEKLMGIKKEDERTKAFREALNAPSALPGTNGVSTVLDLPPHLKSFSSSSSLSVPPLSISPPGVAPTIQSGVRPTKPVTTAAPSPPPQPAATEQKKPSSDYLQSLQNGSLFDGSNRARPSK